MGDYAHSDNEDSVQSDIASQPIASSRLVQDKSLFDDWLRDQREDAHKNPRGSGAGGESVLAGPSLKGLEDAPIISSPREYQTELFERAKTKNIIAVLDTGWLPSYYFPLCCRPLTQRMQELVRPSSLRSCSVIS